VQDSGDLQGSRGLRVRFRAGFITCTAVGAAATTAALVLTALARPTAAPERAIGREPRSAAGARSAGPGSR
jgi:hypothetical protein